MLFPTELGDDARCSPVIVLGWDVVDGTPIGVRTSVGVFHMRSEGFLEFYERVSACGDVDDRRELRRMMRRYRARCEPHMRITCEVETRWGADETDAFGWRSALHSIRHMKDGLRRHNREKPRAFVRDALLP